MDTSNELSSPRLNIASFWRRLGAFVIDCILLGIVGAMLGQLLFDPLARMGSHARLIGFAIALAYFGICNSRVRGGRTFGKQALGLRVVNASGEQLSLARSLCRYAVLGVPYFASGMDLDSAGLLNSVFGYLMVLVVGGGLLSIVYLYVFNRRTRQSLHDLAVGSYVVRIQSEEAPYPLRPVWAGHLVAVVLLVALTLTAPTVAEHFMRSASFADLLPIQQALAAQPHVMSAGVTRGWVSGMGKETHYLSAQLKLDTPHFDEGDLVKNTARLLAKGDARIADEDAIVVNLIYGYDTGLSSGWRSQRYSYKPDRLP
ncbi:RDD family protein [Dyella subtropica]|uniref:RDD family protein n=1 Tax=Dyella subtropica TaxID=2992127 RepID=UPI002257D310|nr:RDD family protein [Dyella subtropica]